MRKTAQLLAAALGLGIGVLCAFAASGIWLDVPFVKQSPEGCGAASISMVMQYWSKDAPATSVADADAAKIQQQLFNRERGGILASDMEAYFRQKNFDTFTFHGTWSDLENHLSKGRPLIVCLREGGAFQHSLHYVVVVGVDDAQNTVLLNDPAGRKLARLDRARFEKRWAAMDHWTLLALPRQAR
jgi:ABC-type bacteriocin/lantibiotic exporter with double-glycine peptidase domain